MDNKINNKGFTLVELLATIAILAIIGVISFVSINGVIEENKVKNCGNLEKSIKSAAKEYVSDKRYDNSFVSSVSGMKVNVNVSDLIVNRNLSDNVYNPFNTENDITNSLIVGIELNDNYTVKEITVYYDKNGDGNLLDDEKFNCNKEWW